jgi:ABC-2 type transport system ATP-binding protein
LATGSERSGTVLAIRGLGKSYPIGHIFRKHRAALRDLTLSVQAGEILGYLGPNGSGKTTTLKVLMGLLRPDSGSATVFGLPLGDRSWKSRVGYLPENPYLYDYLTVGEYLDYVGRIFGMAPARRRERSREMLARVGLEAASSVPLRRCSKGMLQRAGLAQALLNDPDLVFLDEPMSGLDPIGRRLVRDIILELKRAGKTVFFSTHILSDAETLCDRVALLKDGSLLRAGRLDEILDLSVSHMEMLVSGIDAGPLRIPGVGERHPVGERWRLDVDEAALSAAVKAVQDGGGRILAIQPVRQSLEDYFFKELGAAAGTGAWQGG